MEVAKRRQGTKQSVSNCEIGNIQASIDVLSLLAHLFHVSTDYLLGMEDVPRLSVDGLPSDFVAHLALLIEDYRNK